MKHITTDGRKIQHIAAQLYKRARFSLLIRRLSTCFIISLSCCLSISLLNQLKGIYLYPLFFYPFFTGICLITGFVISLFYSPDKKSLLIKADHFAHLKERLSTAYEHLHDRDNPFYEGLLNDAAASAKNILPEKIIPITLYPRVLIFIPLIVLILFFSLVNLDLDASIIFPTSYNTGGMGETLETYTVDMNSSLDDEISPGLSEFARDLELLSMEMQLEKLRKEELNAILEELGLKVRKNMDSLLSELEKKEFSREDLALLSLLAYFSSDTPEAEEFRETLESLSQPGEEGDETGRTGQMESGSEISSNNNESGLEQNTGDHRDMSSYPDYLNTLRSLMDEQEENDEEDIVILPADNRRPEETSPGGKDSEGESILSPGDTEDRDNTDDREKGDPTVLHTGNTYENRDGEAGSSSPSEDEEGSFSRGENESGSDYLFIEGTKENGKLLEFVKQLTGDKQDKDTEPGLETITREYQREMEKTVKEGKIPYEYADMVRDYFLYIGFTGPEEPGNE